MTQGKILFSSYFFNVFPVLPWGMAKTEVQNNRLPVTQLLKNCQNHLMYVFGRRNFGTIETQLVDYQ
ncbi:MAG: hypothetical protein RL372_1569 [Bacteroidota bacterium]|jgi:hypothetical protein